jgi:tetratricopeptide (TPR) repeat protein
MGSCNRGARRSRAMHRRRPGHDASIGRRALRLAAGVLLVAAMGCTVLQDEPIRLPPVPPATDAQTVEQLIAQGNLGDALEQLDRGLAERPQDPALQAEHRRLEALIHDHEQSALAASRELHAQGQWASALAVLEEALQRTPQSTPLRLQRAALREQQAHRVAELRQQLQITQAEALLRRLPLLEELAQVQGNPLSRTEARQARSRLSDLREPLLRCGQDALAAQALERAERCLALTAAIEEGPDVGEAKRQLAELRHARQQEIEQQRRREEVEGRRLAAEQLLERVRAHIRHAQLAEARAALAELLAMEVTVTTPELSELQRVLDESVRAKVEDLMEKGSSLYREEQFEAAKAAWEEALQLDPTHERLRANIDRAERVLEKIRTLQQQAPPS